MRARRVQAARQRGRFRPAPLPCPAPAAARKNPRAAREPCEGGRIEVMISCSPFRGSAGVYHRPAIASSGWGSKRNATASWAPAVRNTVCSRSITFPSRTTSARISYRYRNPGFSP